MDKDIIICRCMELSKKDIKDAIEKGARSIAAIKRRTTAGMGICQGKTCSKLINDMLSREYGLKPEEIRLDTVRPPVRPLSLEALGVEHDGVSPGKR